MFNGYPFVLYQTESGTETDRLQRSQLFYQEMNRRRSCRDFSPAPVPAKLMETILLTAGTAPSGAHKQPWTFCVVQDASLKQQIRVAAEAEERKSYEDRMSEEWLADLAPLGTNWEKPFLETAPYLIIVFGRSYETDAELHKHQNYYVKESVGIAVGLLLAAIHHAGLVALTHTPSPMNFLSTLLKRPANEKPFLLIPVGYPAAEAWVPDLKRKSLEEISSWY